MNDIQTALLNELVAFKESNPAAFTEVLGAIQATLRINMETLKPEVCFRDVWIPVWEDVETEDGPIPQRVPQFDLLCDTEEVSKRQLGDDPEQVAKGDGTMGSLVNENVRIAEYNKEKYNERQDNTGTENAD